MIRKRHTWFETMIDEHNRLPLPDAFVTPGETFYMRSEMDSIDPEIILHREKFFQRMHSVFSQYSEPNGFLSSYKLVILDQECKLPLSDKVAEFLGHREWITVLNNDDALKLMNIRSQDHFTKLLENLRPG